MPTNSKDEIAARASSAPQPTRADRMTLFARTTSEISAYIGPLKGEALLAAWEYANFGERSCIWMKAAIANVLDRHPGQRTGQRTPLKEFASRVAVSPTHLSRLARTYRRFNVRDDRPLGEFSDADFGPDPRVNVDDEWRDRRRPLDPGVTRFLESEFFVFKHFHVAARYTDDLDSALGALQEAQWRGWRANEMLRVWADRCKQLALDEYGAPIDPESDEDVEAVGEGVPEKFPPRRIPGIVPFKMSLTTVEYHNFVQALRLIRVSYSATSDQDAALIAVQEFATQIRQRAEAAGQRAEAEVS